jgi:two-component system phosphate regulon response regulator PhoB
MGSHILLVEDETDLADLVALHLREAGFEVTVVHEGATALAQVQRAQPDLILLDVMLPDVSGVEVCRRLRRSSQTAHLPVIMLTAKTAELDRVVGFEVGADDYVTKPFSPRELVLRVEAILRRMASGSETESPERITLGPLTIDVPAHRVLVEGDEVALTALEFRLLMDLVSRAGRVQSRNDLLERVWGYVPNVETRTVDTHVKRLREKLGAGGTCIETVRGVGYRALKS